MLSADQLDMKRGPGWVCCKERDVELAEEMIKIERGRPK